MKLLNHTLKYLVLLLPVIMAVWASLFYYSTVGRVEKSIDDGLEHYKMLIIQKASQDSTILQHQDFNERNYAIQFIDREVALGVTDFYLDTMMYMLSEDDFEPFRMLKTAFKEKDNYYLLRVVSSTLEKDALVADLLTSMIYLYVVLLLSILIINNLVLRRIWKPFYILLDKMEKFSLDKNPEITPTPNHVVEFRYLDDHLIRLTKQSVATYISQKQFLENAAHELQTPLAISINKLELLAENDDIPETHLQTIVQVTRHLERLTRLNKVLLLLTKIENQQFTEVKQVFVNGMIRQLMEQFEDLAESRRIDIQLESHGDLYWLVNTDLAAILISNLIKNALVHSRPGRRINILIKYNELTIINASDGEALNADQIFERFNKNSSDIQRVGLGLAIARAICQASGLYLGYRFDENQHHFFVKISS